MTCVINVFEMSLNNIWTKPCHFDKDISLSLKLKSVSVYWAFTGAPITNDELPQELLAFTPTLGCHRKTMANYIVLKNRIHLREFFTYCVHSTISQFDDQ